ADVAYRPPSLHDALPILPDAPVLAGRLSEIIGGPRSKINAVVIDAATRRSLFERQADRPATPASTTKLVTSVAALVSLGPAHRRSEEHTSELQSREKLVC